MQLPGWCASQVRLARVRVRVRVRCSCLDGVPHRSAACRPLQPAAASAAAHLQPPCPACNLAGAPATPAASDPPGRCNLKASQAHNLTAHPLLTTDCICRLTTCLPLMTRRCSACNHLTPLPACSPLLSASADVLLTCTCTAHHQALILCGVALLMRKAHAGPKYNKDIKEVV